MSERVAAVRIDDVKRYGAAAALVRQQIRWVTEWEEIHRGGDGWFEGSSDDLANLCGLTARQVRTAVANLIEAGAVERERQIDGRGEGKPRFRVSDPAGDRSVTPGDRFGTARDDGLVTPSYREGTNENPTPTPPEGGDDDAAPSLLDELPVGQRGADRRSEQRKRAKSAKAPPMIVAQAETWLARDWPGAKTNNDRFRTVFAKVLTEGETVADLQRQARNYRRGLEIWAETFGEDRKPMGVGPFLAYRGKPAEGKRHLWDQAAPVDVTVEHCRDVIGWPPPPGRTWERPRRRPRLSDLGVAGG